jgi:hypothetical protein
MWSKDKSSMYRRYADELRLSAKGSTSAVNRATLLKFAEEYDQMALRADQPKKPKQT